MTAQDHERTGRQHRRTALVLGATGGISGETAAALRRHGWQVRALARDPVKTAANRNAPGGVAWIGGDALDRNKVISAAQDAALIVHAVNPPGYRNWAGLVLPMIDNSIAAARASGARILLPGTIYNYGPDAFPILSEDFASAPDNAQGRYPGRAGAAAEGCEPPRCSHPRAAGGGFFRTAARQ